MDSGISKGGIGIYWPEQDEWSFLFFRWKGKSIGCQLCDLKILEDNVWIVAFGTPQAILVSRNLVTWNLLYLDGFEEEFNPYMGMSIGRSAAACSTGSKLIVFNRDEIEKVLGRSSVTVGYGAYIDKLKGLGFTIKHKLKEIL